MKIKVGWSSMKTFATLALGLLMTVLAGCGRTDSTSFVIEGNYNGFSLGADTALTFEREKAYAWSDWEIRLVVRHEPDCQRRHSLLTTSSNTLKVDLYSPEHNIYILRQGQRWYVTDLKSCWLQAFKEPPPVPGTLVGTLEGTDGDWKFIRVSQAVQ